MINGFFVCAAFLISGISITSGEAILKADTSNSSKKSTAEGSKGDDPIQMYLEDLFTVPANLAGLPGISIPSGYVDNKPLGIQLIGNSLQESQLLNVAHCFQMSSDWHLRTPSSEIR